MKTIVYIAASLDGFIATTVGGIEWLDTIPNPQKSDYGFSEFLAGIDGILMGRNTFEKVLTFGEWPYKKPVFVLSNSLSKIPDSLPDNVEIITGSPVSILQTLESRGIHNLYIDGGNIIQSFLKEDLIDEMIITRVSVLLGSGIPLFGFLPNSLPFHAIHSELLSPHLVKTHYRR